MSNYETGEVRLYIVNDEGAYTDALTLAEQAATDCDLDDDAAVEQLATDLQDNFEGLLDLDGVPDMFRGILDKAIGQIDWTEIAQDIWDDFKESDEYQDMLDSAILESAI